jgi:hypothetical protein
VVAVGVVAEALLVSPGEQSSTGGEHCGAVT